MAWTLDISGTVHNPATGTMAPVAWGDAVNANLAVFDAWIDYTPTLTQSATVTKTVTYAKYMQAGKMVWFSVSLAVTSAGTTNNAVLIGLPVTAAATLLASGSGFVHDASVPDLYEGTLLLTTTTSFAIRRGGGGSVSSVGQNPNFALASGDFIFASGFYEAA